MQTSSTSAATRGRATGPTRDGRALGRRLAGVADLFAWPLRVSHYLELVNPLWSTHALRARVEAVVDETADARTLTLRPGRGWRAHRAGQFVPVAVTLDGTRHVRTYSISSAPERSALDGCFTITVKAIPGGRVSGHLVRSLAPGTHLAIGLPQGDFVLPEAMPVRPLFVTAGSGVTPVMSMLRSLTARGTLRDVVHLHFAPRPADVIFKDELAALRDAHPGYRLHVVHTRPAAARASAPGHFAPSLLDAVAADWRDRDVYACGPQGLLAALDAHWRRAALGHRLRVERFQPAIAPAPSGSAGGCVRFVASGRRVMADGETSLLRVAEGAGLNPAHGCRMGICHTCTATLVAGAVRDVRDNRVISEAGTRVQVCVSAAAGDCALDL
jgi:ferredoxin-NADP reductase